MSKLRWAHLAHFASLCGSKQPAADRPAESGLWLPQRRPMAPLQWHLGTGGPPGLQQLDPRLQESSSVHNQRSDPWECRFTATCTQPHAAPRGEICRSKSALSSLYVFWAGEEPGQGDGKATTPREKVNNTLVTLRGWICAGVLEGTGLQLAHVAVEFSVRAGPLSWAVFDILVMRSKISNSFEHQKNLIEKKSHIRSIRPRRRKKRGNSSCCCCYFWLQLCLACKIKFVGWTGDEGKLVKCNI